jgi:septum formation protein
MGGVHRSRLHPLCSFLVGVLESEKRTLHLAWQILPVLPCSGWILSVDSPASQTKPAILLASNSPRRRELVGLVDWAFRVQPADIDETQLPGEPPQNYVLRLAEQKARAALQFAKQDETILAADTIVVERGEILGKPSHPDEALRTLRRLRGRTHHVYTAIALLHVASDLLLTDLACTPVPMRPYSDAEIEAYIASGDPFDKAGSYAIQHAGFRPVEALAGCYANVVGLPLCHLARTFRKLGVIAGMTGDGAFMVPLFAQLPLLCQAQFGYDCQVSSQVLQGEL